jgi:hypothetical protein
MKENPQVQSRSAGLQMVNVVECYEMLRYLYSNVPGVTNCHYYATAATPIVTGSGDGGLRSFRTALIVRFAVS